MQKPSQVAVPPEPTSSVPLWDSDYCNSALTSKPAHTLYLPVLRCVWRLGLGSPIVQWVARWPCPSCTHHRWYCIDTGALTRQWIHKSLIWTSSTGGLLWLEGSHHCPIGTTEEIRSECNDKVNTVLRHVQRLLWPWNSYTKTKSYCPWQIHGICSLV